MTPTILVVGATGNTGKSVILGLPELLKSKDTNYQIIGLTRSLDSPVSKKLASLPGVKMEEKDWTTIDTQWLKERNIVKIFVAPHNLPTQFLDETGFYIAALHAGVKYVVKISTSLKFLGPTSPVYYGRSHWAVEESLSQPEFDGLQWTSLRPSIFAPVYLSGPVEWIKNYQKTGNKDLLKIIPAADVPAAAIDPDDIGAVAARLLALDDPTPHNKAKYVLSGPENVTGKDIVEAMEQITGTKVDDVNYRDVSFLDDLVASGNYPQSVLSSIMAGCDIVWDGQFSLAQSPTSKEILELAPPKSTVADVLKKLLQN